VRRAKLSEPPVFAVASHGPGRVTLAADTAAVAHVFVLEADIVRLLVLPSGEVTGPPSWAVAAGAGDVTEPGRDRLSVAGFACPAFELEEVDGRLRIDTPRLRLEIDLKGLRCVWSQRDGAAWRRMAADRPTQAYNFGWWDGDVRHYLARQPGERYYGLGERAGGMDRAGRRFRLTNLDCMGYDAEATDPLYKSIPYLLVADAEGACHGEFYDLMSDVTFDLGRELDNYHGLYRSMVATRGDLDLYMIAGPDPAAVTRRFTWLTGRPALMPRWSLGYSGSTMAYTEAPDAQARMSGFLDKLAAHDIGCASFHLSSGYTSIGDKRYVFHWNREKFPDPSAFVEDFRRAGVELVPNLKPALLADHPRYGEVAETGLFVSDEEGRPVEVQFWDALGALIDFTNPEAARWWREQVTAALLSHGVQATWNDNNEYEVWDARARFDFFGESRPAAEARPLQPLLMARASRAAQLANDPARRPYVVTRSGMAGLQRYAQTWSGDNFTAWKTLRFNAKMGLGLALSGVSNSGHDVGGFAGPPPDPELLVRWVQAGVLMPRFSIHSWNDDKSASEPWMHAEALPPIRRLMALRQTLIPHLSDLMWRYHRDFEPVIRPVWLDFPADPEAWRDGDDHLLGRDLLVPLVCEPGVMSRTVRPPAGADWTCVWTGARVAGGTTIELAAPLDGPPTLLARAGSALPVDLACGGFRREPFKRGLWLFPPHGDGDFAWSFHEDDGESFADPDIWRGEGRCAGETIEIKLSRQGPGPFADGAITVLPPPGERRRLVLAGAEPVEVEGRRGVRLDLARGG
jgi:alpha-glucosidase